MTDTDVFTYNPEHIKAWEIPQEIWSQIPKRLQEQLEEWQAAGAAILTSIKRIEKLDNESVHRGWPTVSYTPRLSRTPSQMASPSPLGLHSPPTSFSLESSAEPSSLPPLQTTLSNQSTRSHNAALLDTPPWTPDDVKLVNVSIAPRAAHDHVDILQLNDRLSTLNRRSSSAVRSSDDVPFDEAAWDHYIRMYEAELGSLRENDEVRFRHIRREIDKIWIELQQEGHGVTYAKAHKEFLVWWKPMVEKAQALEREISEMQAPDLETVKLERQSHGLGIGV